MPQSHPRTPLAFLLLLQFLLPLLAVPAGAATDGANGPLGPDAVALELAAPELPAAARAVPLGEHLRLERVPLPAADAPDRLEALELQRFPVATPDGRLEVVDETGVPSVRPLPEVAFFRGGIAGEAGSRVVLSVRPDGELRGMVRGAAGEIWLLGEGRADTAPETAPVTLPKSGGPSFACGNEDLAAAPVDDLAALLRQSDATTTTAPAVEGKAGATYTARVAIETDYEYYQKFFDVDAATFYALELIAYASVIYSDEIGTSMVVPHITIRSGSSDPWQQTSPLCALFELGGYWNNNRAGVARTITHFLSGKNNGGGVAWVGVLCRGAFATSTSGCSGLPAGPHGGAYGYTGTIQGTFDIASPTVVWDIVAVAHEIGHNFNSPHTHCYNGIGGSNQPVDQCYSGQAGCYSGTPSLPGPLGQRSGTIMSYCHLLSGGFGNISLNFGTGHPFGVSPERVPTRMSTHVAQSAATYPGCLDLVPTIDEIFADGFETGGTGRWSATVP